MPTPASAPAASPRPRLLVIEAWGVGDVALAIPFLREASRHAEVTLLARPHAAPLLHRFAPAVTFHEAILPWTAFTGKYRLHRWPWRALRRLLGELRAARFDLGVSARPDPRDHALLRLAGATRRLGFLRAGSTPLLTDPLPPPTSPHRAAHWQALATALAWPAPPPPNPQSTTHHPPITKPLALIHPGAAQPTRRWPRERFEVLAARLRAAGWEVRWLDDPYPTLDALLDALAPADLFIGNDSGPGHLAALLDIPTFTIFGPQIPEAFHPAHPAARWIDGAPCPHKPCRDACRFARPHCIQDLTTDDVWTALAPSLLLSDPK